MKATVREYRVTKRVVVLELDEDEASRIVEIGCGSIFEDVLRRAIEDAFDAHRASDAKEDEDVPF